LLIAVYLASLFSISVLFGLQTTMKFGVERVLRQHFPQLKRVISVVPVEESLVVDNSGDYRCHPTNSLTKETINRSLENLMPAIEQLGSHIDIVAINAMFGMVTLRYEGPMRLKKAVEQILLGHPDVRSVEFLFS
jgi:Fe-S cluster biogenesis protein NfuA